METWGTLMGRPLQSSGKIVVFGRGDNPINFVSATDVAALLTHAVTTPSLRGHILQLGGPENLTFNQFAITLQQTTGRWGTMRHIPRPALRLMALTAGPLKPALARQARAALAMDTINMTFDPAPARRAFPHLPETDLPTALKQLLG
jgi:NADH dehydrogenase